MLRTWLLPLVVICSACSDRVVLSGIHRDRPVSAITLDPLDDERPPEPAATQWTLYLDSAQADDALSGTLVPEDDSVLGPDGERPRLMLRCEAGQVEAYVVMAGLEEENLDPAAAEYVRVELDSAQTC